MAILPRGVKAENWEDSYSCFAIAGFRDANEMSGFSGPIHDCG
jgi:hypothetical protein